MARIELRGSGMIILSSGKEKIRVLHLRQHGKMQEMDNGMLTLKQVTKFMTMRQLRSYVRVVVTMDGTVDYSVTPKK